MTASRKKGKCRDYTKCNTETETTAAKGHQTYAHATEKPELGIFWTGKQTAKHI